jgi:hypothetical protein
MVRRVLADDLAAAAGRREPHRKLGETATGVTIAVQVSRFDADESGAVTLTAHWERSARPAPPDRQADRRSPSRPGEGRTGGRNHDEPRRCGFRAHAAGLRKLPPRSFERRCIGGARARDAPDGAPQHEGWWMA